MMGGPRALAMAAAIGAAAAGCSAGTGWLRSAGPADHPLPSVYVRSVATAQDAAQPIRLNREELTLLLTDSLRSAGVPTATLAGADRPVDYILTCNAPELGYAVTGVYPRRVNHATTLSCTISDPDSGSVRWQRQLKRDTDLTKIIDTMPKLPGRRDAELMQFCVLPLMDDMARGVRLFLERPAELRRAATAADSADDPFHAKVKDVERWTK